MKRREISKDSILKAAKELFLKNGYEATSIRNIASEVGISPTTIYLYYKDKAEIMHALHQEGFKLLSAQLSALRHVEEPFERLKAMGRCYMNFAMENRDYYEVMFVIREPMEHLDCWEEGDAAFQVLISTVADCQEHGYFKGYDTNLLALLIWSNMHGLCVLKNDGRLELLSRKTIGEHVDTNQVLLHSFEIYSNMLKKI
jgi:AcrR family transcriptional regulator